MKHFYPPKWRLTLKVLPFVLVLIILKFGAHYFNWEFLTLSSLFTAIISANIFLLGFLISGVLSDYKESEKLPGELASSLEAIYDECQIVYMNKKSDVAKDALKHIETLIESLLEWFQKKERTSVLMDRITRFNEFFLSFEPLTQANFIVRMKQEQNTIRKIVTRIHTIRETSFNAAGYAIAEIITFILSMGLIVIKLDPFYESVFFVAFVSFILIYMVNLIKDLDNPFGYYEKEMLSEEVSLKPIIDLLARIRERNIKIPG
jgi:predicted membrane chloride channel (bestrophin family)